MLLRFPPAWIPPNVPLDCAKVNQAVTLYRWTSAAKPFQRGAELFRWVEKDDLVVVGTYLVHYRTVPYWDIILEGGVRGYSLYVHEFVELKWYKERNLNPFDEPVQIEHYPEAHSLGLLVEHRFLQVVAQVMGYDFSLRELILGNPHGFSNPPQDDWNYVQTNRWRELSQADADFNPGHGPQVQDFYHRLGF